MWYEKFWYENKFFQKNEWRGINIYRVKAVKGYKKSLFKKLLKYFWFIHNNAYFLRKELVEKLINTDNPSYMDFLFDGDKSTIDIILYCKS